MAAGRSLSVERVEQSRSFHIGKVAKAIHLSVLSPYLDHEDAMNFSNSCTLFYGMYQPEREKRPLIKLLQAVVDDERDAVKKVLDAKPHLILVHPEQFGIKVVESKKTWQRFYAESAFSLALKRKQAGMISLVLPYIDHLANGRAEAVKQWELCEAKLVEEKQSDAKQQKYHDILQPLIRAIKKDECAKGVYRELNKDTEEQLARFRKLLLPDEIITLDRYVDIEQFLLAAYEIYLANFSMTDWRHREIFSIRVIGFLQSLVTPELAKIFCEGLNDVLTKGKDISERANNLVLLDEKPFYRNSRDSQLGLGFEYLCSQRGRSVSGTQDPIAWLKQWERLCCVQATCLANLKSAYLARFNAAASV